MTSDPRVHELLFFLSDLEREIIGLPEGYQEVSAKFNRLKNYVDTVVSTTENAEAETCTEERAIDLSPIEKSSNETGTDLCDAILVIDHLDHVVFASPKVTRLLNKNLSELEGKQVWEIFPSLVDTPLQKHLNIVKETRQVASVKQQGETPDTWYEVKIYPVQDGIVLLWTDKSDETQHQPQYERIFQEFKEAHKILQESINEVRIYSRISHEANIQTQSIFNNLIAVAILQEQNGVIQMANSYAIAMFGFDPLHLSAESTYRKLLIEDENGAAVSINDLPTTQSAQGNIVQNRKLFITNPRGRTYTVLVSSMPMQTGKQITGVVSVWNDITRQERLLNEQRRMEEQQAESAIQMEVQRRLLEHREYERQEIARDIHDGPIQNMVSNLFNLQRTKEAVQDPQILAIINQVVLSIKNSVQDLRDVVNELRPPAVLHLGLSRAIRIHSQDIQSRYPELTFHLNLFDDEKLLPENICLALYRIYQEGMNNILRHAHASEVSIHYSLTGQQIVLEIEDNGLGFTIPYDWTDLIQQNHFGIPGMRERAEAIGGQMSITSEPGSGTNVRVEVHLPGNQASAFNSVERAL